MAVRSHYSATSYMNFRPGTRRHTRVTEAEEPIPTLAKAECGECMYKRMAEQYMKEIESGKVVAVKKETGVRKTTEIDVTSISQKPQTEVKKVEKEEPKEQPKGLIARFGAYVAKNQKAMRDAGETGLFDDLGKYAGGITAGAAKLGEEEMAHINRKKSTNVPKQEDDELLDFLSGKRKK